MQSDYTIATMHKNGYMNILTIKTGKNIQKHQNNRSGGYTPNHRYSFYSPKKRCDTLLVLQGLIRCRIRQAGGKYKKIRLLIYNTNI
jgi:hypothetical protein